MRISPPIVRFRADVIHARAALQWNNISPNTGLCTLLYAPFYITLTVPDVQVKLLSPIFNVQQLGVGSFIYCPSLRVNIILTIKLLGLPANVNICLGYHALYIGRWVQAL